MSSLILSCCGTMITENWIYRGHCNLHLAKKELIPCPHPSCSKLFSNENNLTRHISTQHDVPKSIIGLIEPPKVNMFKMISHAFENEIPVSKNICSLPQYKSNPISESYIDDLNNISRTENEEIANRILNEIEFEQDSFYRPEEVPLDSNQLECSFENLLPEEREEVTNLFDQLNLEHQLSNYERDLANGYNQIRDSNVITDTALKAACNMMLSVIDKHFNLGQLVKQQTNKILNSDYILQKLRNVSDYRCKDYNQNGKFYYFNIKDYLEKMIKNDLIWSKLLKEKNKQRDNDIIETIHDLDQIKQADQLLGPKEINVFYNLWFDDFNTSTRTFGNTDLSAVLLSMASIEYKFTTKRHSAGLVALSKKSTRDRISIHEYFNDIREQIKNMQPIEHKGYTVHFRFFCVKADNKAANEMIINIAQSFTKTAACKFCLTNYDELKDKRNHTLRSQVGNHLLGHVFEGCVFYSRNLYAPDIFHDVCEGNLYSILFPVFDF